MMYWLLFVFLFGVVVFIHELGHFLVAKYSGIQVDRFALGFGPALLKKKWGDTEYAICALPLGGYVKMQGEDPEEQKDEDTAQDPRSFSAKPPLIRIAVAAMGPTFNLILPIFIFTGIFLVVPTLTSKIGSVAPNSVAEQAGLQAGDRITTINGQEVWKWEEMQRLIREHPEEALRLEIEREGKKEEIAVTPRGEMEKTPFGEERVGRLGIAPLYFRPVAGISNPNSPAGKAGLQTGDAILAVNGQEISYWWEFERAFAAAKNPRTLMIQRLNGPVDAETSWEERSFEEKEISFSSPKNSLASAGIENGELFLRSVQPGSVAEEKGLRAGDKIVSLNQEKLGSWDDFQTAISKNDGDEVVIGIMRNQKLLNIEVIPKEISKTDELTRETMKRRQLGVISAAMPGPPEAIRSPYLKNPFYAFMDGIGKTAEQTAIVVKGLYKLFTGQLALTKSLGGPITIFYLSGDSYKRGGWLLYFQMMAMLSITLGLLNILPIPVLDGGHILFYVIELVKGSPVSLRVRETAQQVGLVLLLGLILLTFYIDIHRYLDRLKSIFN